MPELSFVVPAFNEEPNIESTLATVGGVMAGIGLADYEIVVIDDGSSDATARLVEAAGTADPRVRLVRHEVNRGLGAAIRSGLAALKSEKFMIVPGDNDMNAGFIDVMARHRDAADMVIAAPLNLEIRPYGRIILSLTYRLLYYIAFQVYVFYINAPCVWPTRLVRSVDATSQRFSIVSEINVKLLRSGARFAEVPGYLSGGKPGGAASWRNLREVVKVFLRLNWEIHVSRRQQFSKRPERVYIDLGHLGYGASGK
ncbi:Glycosyltransferase involved in cell wall bisynthesis [Tistlia consotensis]|uniref:Glycosyltransferase involved in cell wall bisynthesis n=1 Tax=Tistlia consotensis USBA 355 TaxID=560819 RepID=A0A1Y6B8V5_9PROT|nr:glycosyltransferase family 2 protein [Tistlia consotensis]SME98973.1 Glycosyltransferase involved in cell wall bisynthesis [Tistlia consotensis USBA 355]SNR77575.1 Glycosyltransferase involved in cell wall bisynthesis [Tistlia consotensis]